MTALSVVDAPSRHPLAETPGSSSSVRVLDDWYVVCKASDLSVRPMAVELYGLPLVVFRTRWGIGALLDRCPHRNVPLSAGALHGDELACGYHGWRFDRTGRCTHIPCLVGETGARRVPAFAARELDGHIWVYATPDVEPERKPFRFAGYDDAQYTTVTAQIDLDGTVHAAAENALDVPHTAYLHGGLFRTPEPRSTIDVVIRRDGEMAQAEYLGESPPKGLLGRLLAPGGGALTHFDRFYLPCITQVEYALGEDSHLLIHAALTPLDAHRTRLFGVASIRVPFRLPTRLLSRVLRPLGMIVLGQDAKMLKLQASNLRRFGGERLTSTEIDVLGPHILKLLKDAEAGRRDEGRTFERRIQMAV